MKGYINIYRSGFWHKAGKPGAFDLHGGDVYLDRASAVAAIDPPSHYVDTVEVEFRDPGMDTGADGTERAARAQFKRGATTMLDDVEPAPGPLSLTDDIIRYEQGEMDEGEELELFKRLIQTGLAWQLQGHYGRKAVDLIRSGRIECLGDGCPVPV